MRFSHAALSPMMALGVVACDAMRPTTPGPSDAATTSLAAAPSDPTPGSITLKKIGEFDGGGVSAAEIVAYDDVSKRLFVVNGSLGTVDVLDFSSPSRPTKIATISVAQFGASANSVDTHAGVVAVAIEGHDPTGPGVVALYRATTLEPISSVSVGALPDMVTFSPSGRFVLTANEGEPSPDYSVDPEGSVSIIDVSNVNRPTVRTAGFAAFNGQVDRLREGGVRIFGPDASVAQDLEPEYVSISADGRTAWVALQENNALALVDVERALVTEIVALGYKDHSVPGSGLDASDRDDAVNIRPWPVFGMYQPDAIASYVVGGQTFVVTANEGDARDYDAFGEEARVNSLPLDPAVFTDAACGGPCNSDDRLGRLNVTDQLGRDPATGLYEALYAFGGRSFSIRTARGDLVWDSGDHLERLTSSLSMVKFNASSSNNVRDDRSDNKGPEPEGLVVATLGRKSFAMVGLERIGGVAVYDITNPGSPTFVTYANTRQGASGDRGPEGLMFVPAARSPNKEPLLLVGNEISGTTAIFQISLH